MENMLHSPVLLCESLEGLCVKPGGIYVDATLGRGGHSAEIAQRLSKGKLIAIDRDAAAISDGKKRLAQFAGKIVFRKGDFRNLETIMAEEKIAGIDGILFDLGVSSPQLDDGSRGFSYMADAPLDMRMDKSEGLTARDVVNEATPQELARILRDYGEEKFAWQIANRIAAARKTRPVETTFELVELIKSAMPAASRREKQHPAKRSFQALRIAVNDELGAINDVLEPAVNLLNTGGRIAVISFHSLEDRIVKNRFSALAKGCDCPPDFPICVCGKKPRIRLITKHPTLPGEKELGENPRSRSAKLRIAEKL